MKKYVYRVLYEDGSYETQTFDNQVVLSNNEANTHRVVHALNFVESVDVEDVPVVVSEPEVVEAELV